MGNGRPRRGHWLLRLGDERAREELCGVGEVCRCSRGAAGRQADSAERSERYAGLPIVAAWIDAVEVAGVGPLVMARAANHGRGSAFNLRYRLVVNGERWEWSRGSFVLTATGSDAWIQLGEGAWREIRDEPHHIEARYLDASGREYLSITDQGRIAVMLVVKHEDGSESFAEPLINYDETT